MPRSSPAVLTPPSELRLTSAQAVALASACAGRSVWDLGCGRGDLARWLAEAAPGARVSGVDKDLRLPGRARLPRGVTLEQAHFHTWIPAFVADVAVLAAPLGNGDTGLVALLQRVPLVLYIGRNDTGTRCGSQELWDHFSTRELELVVPGQAQDLLGYGGAKAGASERLSDLEHASGAGGRCPEERRALVSCMKEALYLLAMRAERR